MQHNTDRAQEANPESLSTQMLHQGNQKFLLKINLKYKSQGKKKPFYMPQFLPTQCDFEQAGELIHGCNIQPSLEIYLQGRK